MHILCQRFDRSNTTWSSGLTNNQHIGSGPHLSEKTTCTRLLWSWRRQASEMKRACMTVNHFLKERFPSKTWTSIAVLYNPSMPLHRDLLNMIGHADHAVALGNFLEGRVWIEDENGQATTVPETKNGQKLLHGTWIDIHDASVTVEALCPRQRFRALFNPPKPALHLGGCCHLS